MVPTGQAQTGRRRLGANVGDNARDRHQTLAKNIADTTGANSSLPLVVVSIATRHGTLSMEPLMTLPVRVPRKSADGS